MCKALLSLLSPPRMSWSCTAYPDETGIGFTPARQAKTASESSLVEASNLTFRCCHRRDDILFWIGVAALPALTSSSNFLLVGLQLLFKFQDALSEADHFSAGDARGQAFLRFMPPGKARDLIWRELPCFRMTLNFRFSRSPARSRPCLGRWCCSCGPGSGRSYPRHA